MNPNDQVPEKKCHCARCNPSAWWMIVCPTCGNKRCPHATSHEHACTGSNEPGQPGSDYGPFKAPDMFKTAPPTPQEDATPGMSARDELLHRLRTQKTDIEEWGADDFAEALKVIRALESRAVSAERELAEVRSECEAKIGACDEIVSECGRLRDERDSLAARLAEESARVDEVESRFTREVLWHKVDGTEYGFTATERALKLRITTKNPADATFRAAIDASLPEPPDARRAEG